MDGAKPNGVATAQDFRNLAEESAFEPPERVVLPKSGLAVMLRRPRPIAFTLLGQGLPASLTLRNPPASLVPGPLSVAKDQGQGTKDVLQPEQAISLTPDDIAALSKFWVEIFKRMFVMPRLSLTPAPDEIHPDWLPTEDAAFLIRWAVGEVASDGSDLGRFRRGPRPGAPDSSTGRDLEVPPEPVALGKDGSLPN